LVVVGSRSVVEVKFCPEGLVLEAEVGYVDTNPVGDGVVVNPGKDGAVEGD